MKYQTTLKVFEACQYTGPGCDFQLEGVDLKMNHGVSGYARKLAYIFHPVKGPIVVRPKDYVAIIDDEVMVLPQAMFEKSYETMNENKKRARNVSSEDKDGLKSALS